METNTNQNVDPPATPQPQKEGERKLDTILNPQHDSNPAQPIHKKHRKLTIIGITLTVVIIILLLIYAVSWYFLQRPSDIDTRELTRIGAPNATAQISGQPGVNSGDAIGIDSSLQMAQQYTVNGSLVSLMNEAASHLQSKGYKLVSDLNNGSCTENGPPGQNGYSLVCAISAQDGKFNTTVQYQISLNKPLANIPFGGGTNKNTLNLSSDLSNFTVSNQTNDLLLETSH